MGWPTGKSSGGQQAIDSGNVANLLMAYHSHMRVLIDTNIFIELEGTSILDRAYPALLRVLEKAGANVLIHPASLDDLRRDGDAARRERNLSRVQKYEVLNRPPDCTAEFSAAGITCVSPNDQVDCAILCAVYRDAVHFLITEDNGIHKKARVLGVDRRVFYVQQALTSFAATFSEEPIRLPNIEQIYVYEIKDLLATPFFDSMRASYPGFDQWFIEKCCREGREAWCARDDSGTVAAICIVKDSDPEPLTDDKRALARKSLKLCTFKVGPNVQGRKIGELFLKAAFRYARQRGLENIFLTVKQGQQPHLETLLRDFGFGVYGMRGDEVVFVKSHPLSPPQVTAISPLDYHRSYCPHMIAGPAVRKFIVPIRPEYHELLFADWQHHGVQLKLQIPFSGKALKAQTPTPGNALKLAYLCHSKISTIRPGDILLFYRSEDFQEITTVGIVETVDRLSDAEEILKRVLKRTVYGAAEVDKMATKETLVLLFRLAFHVPVPVTRKFLVANGVSGNIQSIRQIDHQTFERIVHEASIQDCLLTN